MYVPINQDIFMDYTTKNHFIECNYSQAKLFHETYGRDESDEAEIFRSRASKLLYKAKVLLDRIKVPFWLSSGTCLGENLRNFFFGFALSKSGLTSKDDFEISSILTEIQ